MVGRNFRDASKYTRERMRLLKLTFKTLRCKPIGRARCCCIDKDFLYSHSKKSRVFTAEKPTKTNKKQFFFFPFSSPNEATKYTNEKERKTWCVFMTRWLTDTRHLNKVGECVSAPSDSNKSSDVRGGEWRKSSEARERVNFVSSEKETRGERARYLEPRYKKPVGGSSGPDCRIHSRVYHSQIYLISEHYET